MGTSNDRFSLKNVHEGDAAPWAFAFFLLFGSILVSVSKWLQFPLWAVIAAPVVTMAGYAVSSWKLPRLELRRDQLGDNLYYLGFLLTLVSLTVTLIQFSANREDDYIISNFGVALVATILGIAGRSLLGQMRKDAAAVERDMQASLSVASSRLRGQISTSLEDFATFHNTMEQITRESADNISKAHMALAKGLAESVDEITSSLLKQVEASRKAIEAQTNSYNKAIDMRAETLNQNIASVTVQLTDAISTHAENIQGVADLNRMAIQDIEEIKLDTSNMKRVQGEIDSFAEITTVHLQEVANANVGNLDASMRSIDSLNDVLDSLQSRLTSCTTEIEASASATRGFTNAARALQGAIAHLELDVESIDGNSDSTGRLSLDDGSVKL